MRGSTVLPVDKNGNAVPVFIPDTGKTQTIAIADATNVAAATAFSNVTKTMAKLTASHCAGDETITFTSRIEGYPSENISIYMKHDAAALSVAVTGYLVTISYDGGTPPTCAAVKAAVDAHDAASKLIDVTYTLSTATLDNAEYKRAFLSGWDGGKTPMIVELTATKACKYHVGPITLAGASAALIKGYIGEGQTKHIGIMPGEIISAVGLATSPGALLYITPGRAF
jgi:hypothetical protein